MMVCKRLTTLLLSIILSVSVICFPIYALEDSQEIVDPYKQYTYEQMLSDIEKLEERYPDLISSYTIGESVEGRDIPVFTLGTGKREILICASMHAREYATTNFVMYMTEQYCKNYVKDEVYAGLSYRKILDTVRYVIVPMMNPDGVNLAQKGIDNAPRKDSLLQMKMTDTGYDGYYAWKANINGVDLNRNWPYNWTTARSVGSPSAANYNGTGPCTEPEVIAMKNLLDSTPYYMLCSFHTSGNVIYWIDNSNSDEYYEKWLPVMTKISNWIGYSLVSHENISDFGGYMVNYARGTKDSPAFTVELCPYYDSYPYSTYDYFQYTVKSVLPIGLLMAEAVMKMDKIKEAIDVTVDGNLVIFPDIRPYITNSRTLVPLGAVCDAMGISSVWDGSTKTITLTKGEKTVTLVIGSNIMTVNGTAIELDTAPIINNARTMMPIKYVAEEFGYHGEWDNDTRTAIFTPIVESENPENTDAENEQ